MTNETKTQAERDAELAVWAASDEIQLEPDDPQILRGEEAKAFGRDLLTRAGRRPLAGGRGEGEKSPGR